MHYLVYQTTNLINGKIYIGIHATENIDDSYMGSGKFIQQAILKYGKENFQKEILFNFDNFDEMVAKEIELVTEEFVSRKDVYNIVVGGMHRSSTGPKDTLKGLINVVDKEGKTLKVSVNDPRYLSGELKVFSKGKTVVKDKDGNIFSVSVDDPRRLSGELVGIRKGIKQSIEQREQKSKSQRGRKHTLEAKEKISKGNKGKKRTEQQCKESSERQTGKKLSKEHKEKISKGHKGKVLTPETKLLMSRVAKGKKRSDETRLAIKQGWIKRKENGPNIWTPKVLGFLKIYNETGINFIFYSFKDAMSITGISVWKLKKRLNLCLPITEGKFNGFKICRDMEILA